MLRGRVGLDRLGDAQAQLVRDQFPARHLVPVDEGDGHARLARAARAADAVDVGLLVVGSLVVDDVGDVGDVDTARGHVGGHQHVDLARAERAQCLLPGTLAEIAVDGGGGEAAFAQVVGDLLRRALGPGEDHRQPAALGLEDLRDQLGLVEGVRAVDELGGAVVDGPLVVLLGPDVGRLVQERPREVDDRAGHGRREQHGLPLLRHHAENALDVGQEAQVEHLVGLVEHERTHLAEHEVPLFGEVEQPARGADHEVDALAQALDLRLVRASAVDGGGAHAEVPSRLGEVLRDLHAQLAGRHHDQRLRRAVARQFQPLQQRNAEPERLAHARAGLADDILAAERERKCQRLDGEGPLDAARVQGPHDVVVDPQFGECRVLGRDRGARQQGMSRLGVACPRGTVLRCRGPGGGVLRVDV